MTVGEAQLGQVIYPEPTSMYLACFWLREKLRHMHPRADTYRTEKWARVVRGVGNVSVFDTFWVGPGLGGGCSVEAFPTSGGRMGGVAGRG